MVVIPFFMGGLVISLLLRSWAADMGRLSFADLGAAFVAVYARARARD